MIRFLLRLLIWFLAALIGIIAADIILPGFHVSGVLSYVYVAAIFAIVQSVLTPFLDSYTRRRARMFSGGIGIVSAAIALGVTNLIAGALSIDSIVTWLIAALLVWLFGALAAFLLPFVIIKNRVEDRRS
jgi:uncharacterized membrane protein YvlD (DUF360 family)